MVTRLGRRLVVGTNFYLSRFLVRTEIVFPRTFPGPLWHRWSGAMLNSDQGDLMMRGHWQRSCMCGEQEESGKCKRKNR